MTSATTATPSASRFSITTIPAVLAAIGVAAGGVLHLQIWRSDYKPIPDGAVPGLWVVKKGFPINAGVSFVVALVLLAFAFGFVVRVGRLGLLAAVGVEAGSIAALVLSREASIFGWKEPDWSSDAKKVIVVEIASVVLAIVTLAVDMRRSAATTAD